MTKSQQLRKLHSNDTVLSVVVMWTIWGNRSFSNSSIRRLESNTSILKHLISKITATGPISVAEYMREALTNPVSGYYVKNDMLGAGGDFITSPEISQIFGEVFSQLKVVLGETDISVHLVEVSPKLSQLQAKCLTGDQTWTCNDDQPVYCSGTTCTGLPIYWYHRIEDVPRGFSVFLAHEFFDALPIHKFQRTENGWREVMVDIDPESPEKLRFVVSHSPTLASSMLIQKDENRQHVEVCPEGGVIVQKMANRIADDGGAALIVDYGHDGTKTDTFRGFKGHQLHNVLEAPGMADLTADVDFSYLRKITGNQVTCLGPITQRSFLKNMGIDSRLQVLLRSCHDPSTRAQLINSYDMLINPEKMGHRFQFFSMLSRGRLAQRKGMQQDTAPLPVAGFAELNVQ
ncbi:protein arginine methyltransferase NDUFAF7, mitochondrial isoform X3 [Ctenopharyngodon idella]|uniref:protein arginine methyltransferase NDUFAF7, mitochondrial isoform X3 n=1 Tax=Ctenopharyngodon idella TaxID=7959 RepID=UPI00222EE23A|nr:protein arginine methyltransferase NDUFAF7, mitochondrial isoform X3 [Ctenopharyngodon idella]